MNQVWAKTCVWVIQKFGALPPLPARPFDGSGASIGPFRAACALLVCGALWGPATNPAPPVVYAPLIEPVPPHLYWPQPGAPPMPRHSDTTPVPAPGGVLLFGLGVVFLAAARRR